MAEFNVLIGTQLDESGLSEIKSKIDGLKVKPIKVSLDTSAVSSQINEIRRQLNSIGNIRLNLGGNGGGGGNTNRQLDAVRNAYSEILDIQKRINSYNISNSKLDRSKYSGTYANNVEMVRELEQQFNSIYDQFGSQFTDRQIANLNRLVTFTTDKVHQAFTKSLDNNAVREQTSDYDILLSRLKQQQSLEVNLAKLRGQGKTAANSNEYRVIEQQMRDAQLSAENFFNTMQGRGSTLSDGQWNTIYESFKETESVIDRITAKYQDIQNVANSNASNPWDSVLKTGQNQLFSGKLDIGFNSLKTQFQNLNVGSQEITQNLTQMQNLLNSMGSASGQDFVNKYKEYNVLLDQTKQKIKEISREQEKANSISSLQNKKDEFSLRIDKWTKSNSAALKNFGAEIEEIKSKLQSADSIELKNLQSQFTQVQLKAQNAGEAGLSFSDRFSKEFSKLSYYFSAAMLITQGIRAIKDMARNVVAVDTAMTELYRVTDLSKKGYSDLFDNMVVSAKTYNTELSTMISSTARWVKLGFDANTANKLAEVSAMYQNVTDLDEETAVKNLVTSYKGFQKQLLELNNGDEVKAMTMVSDILDKLGNEFPVTASEVGSGLTKVASVMQDSGATIQEAAGMITGGGSVTQDFDKMGTALKIATLRIRGMKGQLEELGEDVDSNIIGTSKMQTQILNLTKGKVNIFEEDGKTFKNIYEIFRDIANILPTLNDADRSQLLELVAGKTRSNDILSMLSNWSEVEAAVEAAYNSAGTSAKEQEIFSKSIEGRLKSLKASWQAFSNDFINSDLVKFGITALSGIVDGLDSLVDSLGTVGAALEVFGAIEIFDWLFKGGKISKLAFSGLTSLFGNIGKELSAIEEYGIGFKDAFIGLFSGGISGSFPNILSGLSKLISLLTTAAPILLPLAALFATNALQNYFSFDSQISRLEEQSKSIEKAHSQIEDLIQRQEYYEKKINKYGEGGNVNLLNRPKVSASKMVEAGWTELSGQDYATVYSSTFSNKDGTVAINFTPIVVDENGNEIGILSPEELEKYAGEVIEGVHDDNLKLQIGSKFTGNDAIKEASKAAAKIHEDQEKYYSDEEEAERKRIDLLKEEEKINEKKLAEKAKNAFRYRNVSVSQDTLEGNVIGDNIFEKYLKQVNTRNDLLSKQSELYDEIKNTSIDDTKTLKSLYKELDNVNSKIEDYNEGIKDSESSLRQIYKDFFYSSGEVIEGYEDIVGVIEREVKGIKEAKDEIISGTEEENIFTKLRNQMESSNLDAQEFVNNIGKIQEVVSKQKSGVGLTLEDLQSDIVQEYSSAIEQVGEAYQLNGEKVRELIGARKDEKIAEYTQSQLELRNQYEQNSRKIDELSAKKRGLNDTKEIDAEIKSLKEENSALRDTFNNYRQLKNIIDSSANAYNNWLAVQNESDFGDIANNTLAAFKKIKETLESGKGFGRKYQAALDLIIPDTIDRKDKTAVKNYIDSIQKYVNNNGLDGDKFWNDLKASGFIEDAGNGLEKLKDGTTLQDIMKSLNLTKDAAIALFDQLSYQGAEIEIAGIDDLGSIGEEQNTEATVTYVADISGLPNEFPTITRYVNYVATGYLGGVGGAGLNGTAHAYGTARASGDWGMDATRKVLVGELGRELLVNPRTGTWHTIGDNGAEFINVPKDSIIFNHLQTESLLTNGFVTGRGKSYVNGSANGKAFASGTLTYRTIETANVLSTNSSKKTASNVYQSPVNGYVSTSILRPESTPTTNQVKALVDAVNALKNKGSGGGGGGSSQPENDDSKKIDWIEVTIKRIEKAIDILKDLAKNTFKNLATRTENATLAIEKMTSKIETQNKAYDRYIEEANKVSISDDLKKLVQDGAIDITQYDDKTKKDIESYQKWYDKALEAKEDIEKLNSDITETYKDMFDTVQKDFENQLSLIESNVNKVDLQLSKLEAKGYIATSAYYEAQRTQQEKSLVILNQQLSEMQKSFDDAMSSGRIEKYSESYYEMIQEIESVRDKITETDTNIIELNNSIRDLNWDVFDKLQDRISSVNDEAEFFIDLLSKSKLTEENGFLNDNGQAVIGLYLQRYNTMLAQSEKYANEIKSINEELEKDQNNQDLYDRRKDLIELQRESIIAAEDEKESIKSLIEDSYNKELDSLKKLIDSYTEALQAEKDLYDYQKRVKDQTSEIAKIQKQLAAYANDTSAETKAKVQKLQVDLIKAQDDLYDTEFDRLISNQQKMLDEFYSDYEETLNNKLDETDELIKELIGSVNNNQSLIFDTISEGANKFGYVISDEMNKIWTSGDNVIAVYGNSISGSMTSIDKVVSSIGRDISTMVEQLNIVAGTNIPSVNSYANGTRRSWNEWAWTQENGYETIIRSSDGAILTPLNNDTVFNSSATDNLWKFANNPNDFINGIVGNKLNIPKVSSMNNQNITSVGQIEFVLPNVRNYDEFVSEMQKDPKFEKIIESMTLSKLVGKNSLSKFLI